MITCKFLYSCKNINCQNKLMQKEMCKQRQHKICIKNSPAWQEALRSILMKSRRVMLRENESRVCGRKVCSHRLAHAPTLGSTDGPRVIHRLHTLRLLLLRVRERFSFPRSRLLPTPWARAQREVFSVSISRLCSVIRSRQQTRCSRLAPRIFGSQAARFPHQCSGLSGVGQGLMLFWCHFCSPAALSLSRGDLRQWAFCVRVRRQIYCAW
jgi:hypothetical protein